MWEALFLILAIAAALVVLRLADVLEELRRGRPTNTRS